MPTIIEQATSFCPIMGHSASESAKEDSPDRLPAKNPMPTSMYISSRLRRIRLQIKPSKETKDDPRRHHDSNAFRSVIIAPPETKKVFV